MITMRVISAVAVFTSLAIVGSPSTRAQSPPPPTSPVAKTKAQAGFVNLLQQKQTQLYQKQKWSFKEQQRLYRGFETVPINETYWVRHYIQHIRRIQAQIAAQNMQLMRNQTRVVKAQDSLDNTIANNPQVLNNPGVQKQLEMVDMSRMRLLKVVNRTIDGPAIVPATPVSPAIPERQYQRALRLWDNFIAVSEKIVNSYSF